MPLSLLRSLSPLLRKLAKFWRAKKILRKPKRATVLIYDRNGSELLLEYIDRKHAEILDVRGESINLQVLLRCLLSLDLSGARYVEAYIAMVQPSVALTLSDNSLPFYRLKSHRPNLITVSVQNGWRGIMGDMFGTLQSSRTTARYEVDYLLTLGVAVAEKYREHIASLAIPIGSFRSNHCAFNAPEGRRAVVFISQFRPPTSSKEQTVGTIDGRVVTWAEFYAAEQAVSSFLGGYCERKGLALEICGSNQQDSGEYEFFVEAIGHDKWRFVPKGALCSSYDLTDQALLVIGIDSTLVYESLARGNRTGFFSIREELFGDPAARFGWPARLPDTGPFWTNHADEVEFERIMNHLISVDDDAWQQELRSVALDLIDADPGNTRFLSLMKELDVPVNEGMSG